MVSSAGRNTHRSGYPHVLGVASYNDESIDSSAITIDGYRLPTPGRYNIWRVLSRGAVPSALFGDYLPQITTSPADTAKGEKNPRTIVNAQRMIVWNTPFTGGVFAGAGALTDIQTQNDLTNLCAKRWAVIYLWTGYCLCPCRKWTDQLLLQ